MTDPHPHGSHDHAPGDESIGRPGPWGENRYHKPGDPLDRSVLTPPGTAPGPAEPESTPVTPRDYRFPGTEDPPEGDPPGGDGG